MFILPRLYFNYSIFQEAQLDFCQVGKTFISAVKLRHSRPRAPFDGIVIFLQRRGDKVPLNVTGILRLWQGSWHSSVISPRPPRLCAPGAARGPLTAPLPARRCGYCRTEEAIHGPLIPAVL